MIDRDSIASDLRIRRVVDDLVVLNFGVTDHLSFRIIGNQYEVGGEICEWRSLDEAIDFTVRRNRKDPPWIPLVAIVSTGEGGDFEAEAMRSALSKPKSKRKSKSVPGDDNQLSLQEKHRSDRYRHLRF